MYWKNISLKVLNCVLIDKKNLLVLLFWASQDALSHQFFVQIINTFLQVWKFQSFRWSWNVKSAAMLVNLKHLKHIQFPMTHLSSKIQVLPSQRAWWRNCRHAVWLATWFFPAVEEAMMAWGGWVSLQKPAIVAGLCEIGFSNQKLRRKKIINFALCKARKGGHSEIMHNGSTKRSTWELFVLVNEWTHLIISACIFCRAEVLIGSFRLRLTCGNISHFGTLCLDVILCTAWRLHSFPRVLRWETSREPEVFILAILFGNVAEDSYHCIIAQLSFHPFRVLLIIFFCTKFKAQIHCPTPISWTLPEPKDSKARKAKRYEGMTDVTLVAIIPHINFICRIPASLAGLQKQLRIKLISRLHTLITAGQCGKAILPKLPKSLCLPSKPLP